MTYDDILYDLKEAVGINSDDRSFDIPDSYILGTYMTNRAFLITNTYNKADRILDEDIVQRLSIPMAPVDKGECGFTTSCLINRTVTPLPSRPITTHSAPMLKLSSPYIGAKPIKITSEGKAENVGNSPFTANGYFAIYASNGHIYLLSKDRTVLGIKTLMVKGVFEDPLAISNASVCSDPDCTRVPVKEAMHKQIGDITLQELIQKIQIPTDEINDANGQMSQPMQRQRQSQSRE